MNSSSESKRNFGRQGFTGVKADVFSTEWWMWKIK